jgi:hypothetical protein
MDVRFIAYNKNPDNNTTHLCLCLGLGLHLCMHLGLHGGVKLPGTQVVPVLRIDHGPRTGQREMRC